VRHYPTISDVLKSACAGRNKHLVEANGVSKKVIKARNDCKEVQWIAWQLKEWCKEDYIVIPELRFDKKRRYRFDFAVMKGVTEEQARKFQYGKENIVCGIEYDGLNSDKSGHTTLLGFTKDTEKINLAISLGWKVLRFTCINYQQVLREVEKNIK
jgi:hypothetical protein